ncbi:MAG: transpeptidase family protein [Flavobacteriaceae bacterium]|nr:transpeptidase family protein [Flavobacteriaceae bacterium]
MVLFLLLIIYKMTTIQFKEGDKYRSLAERIYVKRDTVYANRGNVFAADGSLLATSMSKFEIRMDPIAVPLEKFEEHVAALAKELSKMLGNTPRAWENKLRRARGSRNRYLFITRNIGYNDYMKMRGFPIFKLGVYGGGFIAEQSSVRARPLGKIAERFIGYDDYRGAPGIEGAYRKYLKGKTGIRKKQKIAKGQWRPINDNNEREPVDGLDVLTTLDVNIQDITHHSLLRQLEKHDADHGCAIVMDTKSGDILAISNLGRGRNGTYYERLNYAVGSSYEPGSTFKLAALMVGMEDGLIDTASVVDTKGGAFRVKNHTIRDSNHKGYGKISAARVIEVSSNVGIVKLIQKHYKSNPGKFVQGLRDMSLDGKIGLHMKGEGSAVIPNPKDSLWSGLSLAQMSYGYEVSMTPMQVLTFYNAIANNGKMVKPRFVKELSAQGLTHTVFEPEVINDKICSKATVRKIQEILKNVVKRGTGKSLYSPSFSMAGKTGTAQVEYWKKGKKTSYSASFAGFFPAENPKYTCYVMVYKPSKFGYYGADVAGPVFKDIAQKIYTSNYIIDEISKTTPRFTSVQKSYQKFERVSEQTFSKIPKVIGMAGMDAIPILENLGLKVRIDGVGTVKGQSIKVGVKIKKGATIYLKVA